MIALSECIRVFITGDIHGEDGIGRFSAKNWPVGRTLRKDDIVLIAGDFGLVFTGGKTENHWLDWLDKRPWTTLFIDGNHENFPLLLSYPEEERFGGTVGVLRPSVLHLKKRGGVYTIGARRVWCFGGAPSFDKNERTEGKSWWAEEEANAEERDYARKVLADGAEVDFALTHDAPLSLQKKIYGALTVPARTSKFLDEVCGLIQTDRWYFGHHHIDAEYCSGGIAFRALYTDIIEI